MRLFKRMQEEDCEITQSISLYFFMFLYARRYDRHVRENNILFPYTDVDEILELLLINKQKLYSHSCH